MGNKGKVNILHRLANMAFATSKSRQVVIVSFVISIILNIYFIIFSSTSVGIINYDSPDHYNTASSITYSKCHFQNKPLIMKEINWDLVENMHAVCLCGKDNFCRCGPSAATDVVAFTPDMQYIILIDRKVEPLGLATVGGFVEIGEQIEDAAKREFKEETNLDIDELRQVFTYSWPHQDPRRPAISTVFVAKIISMNDALNEMIAGDDAKKIVKWTINEARNAGDDKFDDKFGFDIHRKMIVDAMHYAENVNWIPPK